MIIGLYFAIRPYTNGFESIWPDLKNLLIFMGLGISFSTMQDTTKTQNKISKKIWQDPRKGKLMIWVMAGQTFFFIAIGLFGFYLSQSEVLQELSIGLIILGIGLMSMLKAGIEMFENHRLDKN
jgi:hypothetical protein